MSVHMANGVEHSPMSFDGVVFGYVASGVVGAYLWDSIGSIGYDYELLFKKRPVRLPAIVYFLSRIAGLSGNIACLCFATIVANSKRCSTLFTVVEWSLAISISMSSLLFLLRVRALYANNRLISWAFLLVWLGVVTICTLWTRFNSPVEANEDTRHCIITGTFKPTMVQVVFKLLPLVYDFLVFCAITCKLMDTIQVNDPTTKTKIVAAILGTYLPKFSRALLKDGQAYFLLLLPVYTVTISSFCLYPSNFSHYAGVVTLPTITISNLMACKIYRQTKFGLHTSSSDTDLTKPSQSMKFNHSLTAELRIRHLSEEKNEIEHGAR